MRFNEEVVEHILEPSWGKYADMVKSSIIIPSPVAKAAASAAARPRPLRPQQQPLATANRARHAFAAQMFRPRMLAYVGFVVVLCCLVRSEVALGLVM